MPELSGVTIDPAREAMRRGMMAAPTDDPRKRRDQVSAAEEDAAQFLSVDTLRRQYTDYLTSKVDEVEEQKEGRRYYHGAFYTAEQLRILKDRHQPPLPWNRVKRKINRRVGLIGRMRSDPKAFGNNPKSEQGAEIATQSIRSVLDGAQFKTIDAACLLQAEIEANAGVQMVLTRGDTGDVNLTLHFVVGDEYFYDPTSYSLSFADSGFEGLSKWLSIDKAIELFPEREESLRALLQSGSDMTTNPDREIKWTISTLQKVRVVEHWYQHRGKWCWAFYVADCLLDQGVSPFIDENGKSISSFVMFSRNIDQDGDRYGDVRDMKGPQDALNAGKSKILHIANSKQIKLTKGIVDDVEFARREVARPDGVVELNQVANGTFKVVDTKQDLAAFVQFTEDAKAELEQDADGAIAQMPVNGLANLSGRAIELLRQPGMAELGPFINTYRGWKLRLYRGIWNTIARYWTKERWIRVTNNQGLAQFIQLNGLGLDQLGRPTILNAVGALDVDIVLEEGPDVPTMQQDFYDALLRFPPGAVPPQIIIEANPAIPRSDKDRYIQMLKPQPTPEQQIATRLSLEGAAADVAQKGATVRRTHAQADQATATAQEKLAKVGTESARAAHLASSAHLDAAEFARDTMLEAQKLAREFVQPQAQPAPAAP